MNNPLVLFSGEAALPSGPHHEPATQRLPDPHQDAQADLGAAGVYPRHPSPQQKPHRRPALSEEEAGLHPEPGGRDPQTGTLTV